MQLIFNQFYPHLSCNFWPRSMLFLALVVLNEKIIRWAQRWPHSSLFIGQWPMLSIRHAIVSNRCNHMLCWCCRHVMCFWWRFFNIRFISNRMNVKSQPMMARIIVYWCFLLCSTQIINSGWCFVSGRIKEMCAFISFCALTFRRFWIFSVAWAQNTYTPI